MDTGDVAATSPEDDDYPGIDGDKEQETPAGKHAKVSVADNLLREKECLLSCLRWLLATSRRALWTGRVGRGRLRCEGAGAFAVCAGL